MASAIPAISNLQLAPSQPVPWLWPDRIAAGRFTLIDGDPEQGKSLLTLDLAARLTIAQELPDGYRPPEPIAVLLLPGGEDNLADTIIPRLRAAGADLRQVHVWQNDSAEPAVFPEACAQLQEAIARTRARLVLFDPFFAYLGPDIGSLNDLMIRRALGPLARVAEATQAALVLIRHLAKGNAGKAACYRGLGSMSDAADNLNELVDTVARIAGKDIRKRYDLTKPQGVRGRNSDNSLLLETLNWQPTTTLEQGLATTYEWIRAELDPVRPLMSSATA